MRRLGQAMRGRPAIVLGLVFVVAQIVRALITDWTAPELTRGGGAFSIGPLAPGAVLSQTFDVTSGALEAVRLAGGLDGGAAPPQDRVEAHLIEVYADASERRLRVAPLSVTDDGDCCEVRFPVVPYSARRRYRIEVRMGERPDVPGLVVRAMPARDIGGLVVNGRPQPSNLVMDTIGAERGRLRGARRVNFALVMTASAIFDAAWLGVAYALLSTRVRRPS